MTLPALACLATTFSDKPLSVGRHPQPFCQDRRCQLHTLDCQVDCYTIIEALAHNCCSNSSRARLSQPELKLQRRCLQQRQCEELRCARRPPYLVCDKIKSKRRSQ